MGKSSETSDGNSVESLLDSGRRGAFFLGRNQEKAPRNKELRGA